MRPIRFLGLLFLVVYLAAGCKSSGAAGLYHIEQDGASFGPGAEKFELNLRNDKTFEIGAGQLTMFKGTWKEENGQVVLSSAAENMGTIYKFKDGKLTPEINGKDVTFWRWVRK